MLPRSPDPAPPTSPPGPPLASAPGPGWEAPASRSCIVPLVLRFATPFLAHRLVVLRSFL